MPLSVRRLVSALQASVEKSFPASKFIVSTGYLFLRVIVPCILQPDKFGMCHRALEDRDRRNLMLVGKVLQNLANASQFGDKEEHMRAMNPFLEKHQLLERLKAYMQILGNQEDFGHASHLEPTSVDEGHTIEDQMLLHHTLLTVSVSCFQIIDLLGIADQISRLPIFCGFLIGLNYFRNFKTLRTHACSTTFSLLLNTSVTLSHSLVLFGLNSSFLQVSAAHSTATRPSELFYVKGRGAGVSPDDHFMTVHIHSYICICADCICADCICADCICADCICADLAVGSSPQSGAEYVQRDNVQFLRTDASLYYRWPGSQQPSPS